jgi:hypothetical protein
LDFREILVKNKKDEYSSLPDHCYCSVFYLKGVAETSRLGSWLLVARGRKNRKSVCSEK